MGIRIALKAFPADVLTELNQLWIHEWLRSISLRTRKEVVSFRVFFFRRVYFSKESLEKKKIPRQTKDVTSTRPQRDSESLVTLKHILGTLLRCRTNRWMTLNYILTSVHPSCASFALRPIRRPSVRPSVSCIFIIRPAYTFFFL